jgi:phenylalanyl-tRNA synthetase beta chain
MKFTLGWLKDHLETEASAKEIAEILTMVGLQVEDVADKAAELAPFVVGYVEEARPHPNADRLKLCRVQTGKGTREVVCGAPNARTGMKGVFAFEGTLIPGTGQTLTRAKIRGVESSGMLCSERELGLSDEHQGIIELPSDAEIGSPAAAALGVAEPVINVELTPNRADCAGVRGIARDLAAAGIGTLKPFVAPQLAGTFKSPIRWRREFADEASTACPLVVGRYFRGVRNGPSPKWLQDRLKAIGLRPISALVDITNYITFDLARPLHVFDADRVKGDLVMRLAKPGESIRALDGRDYALDGEMTVIADAARVLAVGGIIGGEHSGCTPETRNVFLEVALFDPKRTTLTARKLGISSDARYRFERGVDPHSAQWGVEIATRMILDLCGGAASDVVSAGEMPAWERQIRLRKVRLMGLGGVSIPDTEPARILAALGFASADDGREMICVVPSWRPDVEGEADLIEEVLRIYGYHMIPPAMLPRIEAVPKPALDTIQRRIGRVRRALAGRGLVEAVTYSFMARGRTASFGGVVDALVLDNPISAELDAMRPSILPNLLDAANRNLSRGVAEVTLFEIGAQYSDATPSGQREVAAGVRVGAAAPRHWAVAARPVDALDAKGDALAALAAAGGPADRAQLGGGAPAWYHPGRSGTVRLGPSVLAAFGELHPRILREWDLRGPVVAFEVFLDQVPAAKSRRSAKPVLALSPLQPVERDFAFVVDEKVDAGSILRAARGADKELIAAATVFDLYRGPELGDAKKSVAISVTLQPTKATLTDAEIEAVGKKIVAAVTKATGGVLRT